MLNHDDLDTVISGGGPGEWDEPSNRGLNHQTHWSDFPEGLTSGNLEISPRPRWPGRHIDIYTRSKVLSRCGHRCQHCGAVDDLQIDHIRPVARGGSDEEDNLQVLCAPCNRNKGARFVG